MKMDKEYKKESKVRLEPNTLEAIKKDVKASTLEIQLKDCNVQIAILEKDKEHNEGLLHEYYAVREGILNQIKAQEIK